jgi:chaperonin GroES
MLRPLHDWVLVKRLETEDKIGSLHVPDAAKAKAQKGEVLAVGKGHTTDAGHLIPPEVKKGDVVLFGKYSGNDVTLDGEDYITMRDSEILGVLE